MFWANIRRRIIATVVQLRHAETNKNRTAKSSYYRAAIMIACTIVEGLVYQLVKEDTRDKNNIVGSDTKNKILHIIPMTVLNRENIFIGEKEEKKMRIDDRGVTFELLNLYLKKNSLVSLKEFKKLDNVRIERNKIHIQSIDTSDIGYTKRRFNYLAEPIDFLTRKIESKIT